MPGSILVPGTMEVQSFVHRIATEVGIDQLSPDVSKRLVEEILADYIKRLKSRNPPTLTDYVKYVQQAALGARPGPRSATGFYGDGGVASSIGLRPPLPIPERELIRPGGG